MTKLSIPLPSSRYRTIVESAVNACRKLAPDNRLAFLAQTLDFRDAGSNLSKVGIQRHHLLDEEQLKVEINSQSQKILVTNGMIVDLHLFRKKTQINWSTFSQWILVLGITLDVAKLKKQVEACVKENKQKQKNKGQSNGVQIYEDFLSQPFIKHVTESADCDQAHPTVLSNVTNASQGQNEASVADHRDEMNGGTEKKPTELCGTDNE